jgi:hypothetical protein
VRRLLAEICSRPKKIRHNTVDIPQLKKRGVYL